MMSFLAPLALLGLAALVIPVLVHLIQRERRQVIEFPSLMFLKKIPYRSMRRQKIRHWFLLLLRCAALALIVAAFARPFFNQSTVSAVGAAGARELVVLLDRSYSMGYGDRWARAQAAARAAIDGLAPEDRATVVRFASGAEAGSQSSVERGSLLAAIDSTEVGIEMTRFGPALQLAAGILEQSDLPRREIVMVSDFQALGGESATDVRLPEGTVVTAVSVAEPNVSNVAVTNVSFERDVVAGFERVAVTASVRNQGSTPFEQFPVILEIEGAEPQTVNLSLEPGDGASVGFEPVALQPGQTRGTVRVEGDPLPRDDAFYFVLAPGQVVSTLILEDPSDDGEPGASLYLREALATGRAPVFHSDTLAPSAVEAGALDAYTVAVLNDAPPPTGEAGSVLREFIESGGGLLVVLGERSSWPAGAPELLPGTIGPPVDRMGGGTLGFVDYSHPVFELFAAPRSGDLSAARFFRYRALESPEAGQVIARFDDGAVALVEHRVGLGRVLVWTSTLDSFWSDFAVKPVFLPFVHRAVEYLADYQAPAPWFTAGQVLDLSDDSPVASAIGLGAGDGLPRVVNSPTDRRISLDAGGRAGFLDLTEVGFFDIHTTGADEATPTTVAVNVDVRESDLTTLDVEEFSSAVAGRGQSGEAGGAAVLRELSPAEQEARQAVWWYLLAAGFVLLGVETVVSNRLSRLPVID